MSARTWWRPAAGLAVVAVLVVRFGADPVIRGVQAADGVLLVVAVLLTAVATACCAWRWRAVAGALDAGVGFAPAFLSCYGSQFLNAVLPTGVLGDVHRAVEHGRRGRRAGPAARSVLWERALGLVVQAAVTLAVVALVPTGLRRPVLLVGLVAGSVLVGLTLLALGLARAVVADLAAVLRRPRTVATVAASSLGVGACHAGVLLCAMASVGVALAPAQALVLALTVLLGSTVPTSIAGWGPREGAAAWAFAAVGLSASDGLAVAVAYGVAAFVATLPGALALLVTRLSVTRAEATIG